ncbi:MAG: tetratricopeptide repeat protein [Phycisphaerales bacterium]|nr:MAG: tetratricopeptide repeat protein [Phycisphaerales bacterium]
MRQTRSSNAKARSMANDPAQPTAARLAGSIWAPVLLLVVITAVAYLPVVSCGFIWDDDSYVQENQTLRSVSGLSRIWFELGATLQYYPLVHTTYWLEYRLWGLNPTGYHVVNILLHALGAVLLWRVSRFLSVPAAWVVAAVFALHPVHVESVAWITERKNVLSGVFYFGAALAFLRFALSPQETAVPKGKRRWLYVAALVLFLCALLSKTVTCTLPAALLVVLWWHRKGIRWADALQLAPFFILGIALGLLTVWMERHEVGAIGEEWSLSPVERCLIAGRALFFYTGKLVWPHPLIFVYPRWGIDATIWWQHVYPVMAVIVVIVLWLCRRRIGRGPLAAVLLFGGTLVPALGFFDIYPMRYSFVADHFQYLAGVGVIALVVVAGYRALDGLGTWGTRLAPAVAIVALVTLGALTWRQGRVYLDAETLWRDTLSKNPDVWLAHNNLGNILERQGKLDEAIDHHQQALQVEPRFALNVAHSHYNLGNALAAQRKFTEATKHYRETLRNKPDYVDARVNLGNMLLKQGNLDEAVRQYRQAVKDTPKSSNAHYNLGTALFRQGKLEEASAHFRQAVEINPGLARAHYMLGLAQAGLGLFSEALQQFREAARIKPDWPAPLAKAAWIMAVNPDASIHDETEAIRMAERAADMTGRRNGPILDTLAAAYAAAGRFDQAVATEQAAIDLASQRRDDRLLEHMRLRLDLYKQERPYQEIEPPGSGVRP